MNPSSKPYSFSLIKIARWRFHFETPAFFNYTLYKYLGPCLLGAAFFILPAKVSAVQFQPTLVPENTIQQKNPAITPYWKKLWDEARGLARVGNYEEAAQKYSNLLIIKKELNEARWELASILLHLGKIEQGTKHLELLIEAEPDNSEYLNKLGTVLNERGHFNRAMELFSRSYKINPDTAACLSGLSSALIKLGRKKEALPLVEKLYNQKSSDEKIRRRLALLYYDLGLYSKAESHVIVLANADRADTGLLIVTAKTLDRLGKESVAASYWQRVLERDPNNEEGRKSLTAFYKNEGRVNEALSYLLALLKKHPGNSALLNQIGRTYVETGKPLLGLPYLESYLELRPDDRKTFKDVLAITLGLANESLDRGNMDKSRHYLEKLATVDDNSPEFLLERAALQEKLLWPEHAIKDYEAFLDIKPDRHDIRLKVISLAGQVGNFELVKRQFKILEPWLSSSSANAAARLIYAKALVRCGVFEQALPEFQNLVGAKEISDDIKIKAFLGLAGLYEAAGLPYESEQYLRMALNLDGNSFAVLSKLFELSLNYSSSEDDAGFWLSCLNKASEVQEIPGQDRKYLKLENNLMRARFFSSRGAGRAAIKIGRKLLDEISDGQNLKEKKDHKKVSGITLALAKFYLAAGRPTLAERLIRAVHLSGTENELEGLVVLQLVYKELEDFDHAADAYLASLATADLDLGAMIYLARVYRGRHLYYEMVSVGEQIVRKWPTSLEGRFLFAEALELSGNLPEALDEVEQVLEIYPQNMLAFTMQARLLFRMGQYERSLTACRTILRGGSSPQRPDIRLLKARNLWALDRWEDSVKIYKAYLDPSVEELFKERMSNLGFTPIHPPRKKTFWDFITFSSGSETRLIDQVLNFPLPDLGIPRIRELNRLATPYYAQYRWQKDYLQESAARISVQRREYMHAADEYESVIKDKPLAESVFFDLGGVYSRLGRLGDEAAIYEQLVELNPEYPGLTEARERNRLKRRPKVFGGYGFRREEGWDGYKDIEKEWQHAGISFSPATQHEARLSVSRIHYSSVDHDATQWSKRFFLDYQVDILGGVSFSLGGGIESNDDGSSDTGLLLCKISGKLGDKIRGHLKGRRDVTSDTIAALARMIVREKMEGGVDIDILPRLAVGVNYDYLNYSDENDRQGYDLWGSYIISYEPTLLKISYAYKFMDSKEGSNPGPLLPDGFAADDHPYWAPMNYWQNSFTLFFKQKLSKDTLDRGVPSYYTLEYSPGYDSRGYGTQSFEASFYMEMTPKFIAEFNGRIFSSQVYRSKDIFLSVAYRW